MLRTLQLGLGNALLLECGLTNAIEYASDDKYRQALLRVESSRQVYSNRANGVVFLTPILFRASIPLPAASPLGHYDVDVRLFARGALIARATSGLEVNKVGFTQYISTAAEDHGVLYGLGTVLMAILTGWSASVAFGRS